MNNAATHTPARSQPTPADGRGDVDIAAVGALLADRGRCRVLMALNDGRSMLASEAGVAGVAASTASSHLRKLADAGLITVDCQGRNRYYRLTGLRSVNFWK